MAKAKRRSRNIARKPKSHAHGFVPQNTNASSNGFAPQTSEQPIDLAASPSPEPAPGFVPQNANASSNGFVPQNVPAADTPPNDRAATNRTNAAKSTGPRTAEGKARSSQNARKHGLSLQRHAILPGEDPTAYNQLLDELDRATRARHAEARHLRQQEDAVSKAELHQLRLAEVQAKLTREQARTTREETRSAEQAARAAREAAKAAAQQSETENSALFDALARYLNTLPNAFTDAGFVPQNAIAAEKSVHATHGE